MTQEYKVEKTFKVGQEITDPSGETFIIESFDIKRGFVTVCDNQGILVDLELEVLETL